MTTCESDDEYVAWLLSHSMLEKVRNQASRYTGQGRFWQYPYAEAQPRTASSLASVWLTTYPPAIMTRPGESVLHTLGNERLWKILEAIGIQGIHTGPMKRAGSVRNRELTPTIDGYFDRISLDIDPAFGSEEEYTAMSKTTAAYHAVVIDDIIPAHTGKGADFRLAERAYKDYPGLYHMVEIRAEDWELLPAIPEGRDSVNLLPETVDALAQKGYIVGRLPRTIFYEPGVKETDWSATAIVCGVDGVDRRWVYLHYFKEGQPALNWLDPSMAAAQLIIGDALQALELLGARGLRLDANGFLGIEVRPDGSVCSEGHLLSIVANQLIAGMVRKDRGFTFQELNLAVDDIAAMSKGGADLSYDFITRPAYHHALVSGDTEFLRLMLRTVHNYKIDPASLIHALQNHDELTLELVHFWWLHANDVYVFQGRGWTGSELRDYIRAFMYERLTGENAPYNQRFVENGVACTTVSVITAALGITSLGRLTDEQIRLIQRIHLLLVMYNGFQPGVLALSGWDLVGALPLDRAQVEWLLEDNDTRWINRGAYDLIAVNPDALASPLGLPKARALYGPLTEQLKQPDSFAGELQRLLAIRQTYRIYASEQMQIPDVASKGLLVMVHQLPDGRGVQVTALNFGPLAVDEDVLLAGIQPGLVINMLNDNLEGQIAPTGHLSVRLEGYEGKSLRIDPGLPVSQ